MTGWDRRATVLVTGASGFTGEHLTRRFAAGGFTVVGTVRSRSIHVPGARIVRVDLGDRDAVRRMVREVQPGVVFHCAARTHGVSCQNDPAGARVDIVAATQNLAQALSEFAPETPLVALSTDLVFDGEHAPYREEDPTGPVLVYGQLKLEAESAVLSYPTGAVARTSIIYGCPATHKASFLGTLVERLAAGCDQEAYVDEVRTPIWVDDLCDVLVAMAAERVTGLWHAGGPQRLNRLQIAELACDALGLPQRLLKPCTIAESTYPVPRPRDVSLDNTKLLCRLNPRLHALAEVLPRIRAGFLPSKR